MQTELNYDTVFDAQEHFRLILDSMARPGKINVLPVSDIFPPESLNQAAALTGFALLNPDVTFLIAGENRESIAGYLLVNTAAKQAAEAEQADYAFIPEEFFDNVLYALRTGTPKYPEDSATLIVNAELISEQPHGNSLKLTLKGPGVNGEAQVFVSGISADLLDFVKEQNSEYPLGIDLIMADRYNNIIGLPRSNDFSFSRPEHIDL
jgi:alpha-D-ribose 1-methylphosphonate 5-triphosphate synthase subunit PhnH